MMAGLGEILVVLLLAVAPGNQVVAQQPLLWLGSSALRSAAPAALLWGMTSKPVAVPAVPALPVP
jgi:hypothetical protein